MNTTPENNESEATESAAPEGPVMTAPEADEPDESTDSTGSDESDEESAAVAPPAGGIFSAESFGIAGVLAIVAALIGTRLSEMFASVTAQDQISGVSSIVMGDAGTALIGVILGLVSLGLTNESTRSWARWIAMACIVVGVLFVLGSMATYVLTPSPSSMPQQPSMGG